MTIGYTIASMLEIIALIVLVFGLIFEDKVAAWEQRTFDRIKRRIFNKHKSNIITINRRPHEDKVG